MSWQKGPLPPDTWNWGGVVPVGEKGGFFFADFQGDHVTIVPDSNTYGRTLQAHEVAWYDNSLTLPPDVSTGAQRLTAKD
jgi:hypothetical protein